MVERRFVSDVSQLVPFEITACNVIIGFWSDVVPVSAIIAIIIVLYALVNLVNVKWYGEVNLTDTWTGSGSDFE